MPGPDPYASMPHHPDCGRGPHCECDPPDADEYDEPNDGYDHDAIYEMVANIEMAKAFQPSRTSEVAAQLAAARLVGDDPCINPTNCCGHCQQADEVYEVARQQRLHDTERTRRQAAEHVLRLIAAHPVDAATLARDYLDGLHG